MSSKNHKSKAEVSGGQGLDFTKLPPREVAPQVSQRPIVPYWVDVWLRLTVNRQAITSLYVLVALLTFTLLGPLAWNVSPSLQNLNMISRSPEWSQMVRLVDTTERWQPPQLSDAAIARNLVHVEQTLPAPNDFRVQGTPHTQGVRLVWSAVPGAIRYHLYRNNYKPSSINELGLPLGATNSAAALGFEDQLQLRPRTYYYSVVADNGVQQSPLFTTVAVTASQAISIETALDYGLLPKDLIAAGLGAGALPTMINWPAHPFGTDHLGRDMLARLMQGARTSLFIGIVAPLLFVFIGAFYGALAGLKGGRVDSIMMRFADFIVALPFLLFVILFRIASGTQSGESGIGAMLFAFIVLLWPATARLVRGQVLQLKTAGYVQAARMMGASTYYLLIRQLLPGTAGVILVTLTFAIPAAIFTETFLSFIGMGVAPPTASWGSMCFEGLRTMTVHPHELLFPAIFISLAVLAFNLLGDGLRDALDTRLRNTDGGTQDA